MTRKQSSNAGGSTGSDTYVHSDPVESVRRLVASMAGQRLPSERVLAAKLSISRPSLRSILATLQNEGVIEARPRSGTYVVDLAAQRLKRIVLLIDADLKLGDDPFILTFVDSLQRAIQAIGARCLIERVTGIGQRQPLEDGALTLGMAGQA